MKILTEFYSRRPDKDIRSSTIIFPTLTEFLEAENCTYKAYRCVNIEIKEELYKLMNHQFNGRGNSRVQKLFIDTDIEHMYMHTIGNMFAYYEIKLVFNI